jgi:photosystem II stability/assembly factor-like uncharacterized protein
MRKFWLFLLTTLLLTTPLSAAWSRAGLFGADVRALVAHPASPDLLYLGTSQGEIYVSRDGGKNWNAPRGSTPFPGYVVDNLTIDAKGRLWVAAWGLWGGGVVAVSGDGGATWSRRDGGLESFSVRAIAHDAKDEKHLVIGGLDGVYETFDSGFKWNKISDQVNVESLAIDPRSSETIFVGTWRQGWRTDDGGKTWKQIATGMVLDTDMFAIHINPRNPDSVWVATCGWVYNSKNRGDEWTRYREGFKNRRIHDVEVDPQDDNLVYAGSVAGLYRSKDAGANFELMTDESLVVNSIVLHPERPDRIILGTEGDGVYVSTDRGATFVRSNLGLYNVRVATVASDPAKRDRLYAAVVFGNAASGIYLSENGGDDWNRLSTTKLPEILTLVVQNISEPKFVAGTEKGFYWSADGVEWTLAEQTAFPLRVQKIVQYSNVRLFAGTSEGVFTSKDGGKSWYRLADLKARTTDVAVGMLGDKRSLFAMTSSGLLAYNGEQWMTVEGAPQKGSRLAIREDRGEQVVVIGGLEGIRVGSIDYTAQWHDLDAPEGSYSGVHQASGKRSVVVLATRNDHNLLVSSPAKDVHWRTLPTPLDPTTILDVSTDTFDDKTLYFGTMGQGVFIYRGGEAQRAAHDPGTYAAGSK